MRSAGGSAGASLLASALVMLGGGCRREPVAPARPNVLLIVVDTLRRDALGVYGAERPTPAIDALAGQAVVFDRAYSAAPWTKPSVATIFTGQLPSRHRCRHIRGGLAPQADTLAEILGRDGYARRGVVSHRLIAGRSQLDQGFERYRADHARGNDYVSTDGVVEQGLEDLKELADGGRPFLLFLHFFDPHARYLRYPGAKYAPARAGRLDGSEELPELRALAPTLTPEERAFLRAIYLEEVRRVDDGIARVLERVRALRLWHDTAIIFTSDHGEELGQRGWLEHTRTLHDELVRVPLIVKPPRGVALVAASGPVSLTSILPTLLEWTGARTPATLDGRSLSAATAAHPEAFSEVDYKQQAGDPVGEVRLRGIVAGHFKLIVNRRTGRFSLFDLDADPGERRDLAEELRRETAALTSRLSVLDAAARGRLPDTPDELDEETREVLRSLGYVGG